MTRKRRTDAEANATHIVAVAHTAFAAEGLAVPIRTVATRAGVGVATVYRHFPTRDALVGAVLAAQVTRCSEDLHAALADPDPGRALRTAITGFGLQQLHSRGLLEALAAPEFTPTRRAHAESFAALLHRARIHGAVRAEVTLADARTALLALGSLRSLPPTQAKAAIGRLTALLLKAVMV